MCLPAKYLHGVLWHCYNNIITFLPFLEGPIYGGTIFFNIVQKANFLQMLILNLVQGCSFLKGLEFLLTFVADVTSVARFTYTVSKANVISTSAPYARVIGTFVSVCISKKQRYIFMLFCFRPHQMNNTPNSILNGPMKCMQYCQYIYMISANQIMPPLIDLIQISGYYLTNN